VPLHEEHEQGVELVEGVEDPEEVAWMAVGGDGEEVAQGGRDEGCELSFGEEFEEGGFVLVEGRVEGGHELHVGREKWIAIENC